MVVWPDINQKYLIACSGGIDSMVLLDLMTKRKYDFVVCHVDYNFRKESKKEIDIIKDHQLFYQSIVENLIITENVKGNFQNWAREKRFDFFIKMAKQHQIWNLLIGHQWNDSLETRLIQTKRNVFNKNRFLPPVSNYKNIKILRPLLKISKEKIKQYATNNRIQWIEDTTNKTKTYLRNVIREKVYTVAPKTISTLEKKPIEQNLLIYKQKTMSVRKLLEQKTESQIATLSSWLNYFEIPFTKKYVIEILKQLVKITSNVQWDFKTKSLVREYDNLKIINKQKHSKKTFVIENSADVLFSNTSVMNGLKIYLSEKDFPLHVTNDYKKLTQPVFINNIKKKINRYYIEKKIPFAKRENTWIVSNNKEILVIQNLFIKKNKKDKVYYIKLK